MGWNFLVGGPFGLTALDDNGTVIEAEPTKPFAPGRSLILALTGSGKASFTFDGASKTAVWAGTASVVSHELESPDALESRARGRCLSGYPSTK
jgi:hypothetical protein